MDITMIYIYYIFKILWHTMAIRPKYTEVLTCSCKKSGWLIAHEVPQAILQPRVMCCSVASMFENISKN